MDSLGDRMKGYENINRNYLTGRMPVIIRIDGKAFHSFTRGCAKPFDYVIMKSMWETAKFLCENIQGCKTAYVQSDEISLLLNNYETLDTCAWFDNNIQKMVSVSASMATLAFNKAFHQYFYAAEGFSAEQMNLYSKKLYTAMFDSRVFILPKEEVCNYFIWRQQDATKNSISMIARSFFSDKQLHGKNGNQMQEMIFQESGKNFNDYPVCEKRGICVVKETYMVGEAQRNRWVVDMNIPIFTQDREYIEKFIKVKED